MKHFSWITSTLAVFLLMAGASLAQDAQTNEASPSSPEDLLLQINEEYEEEMQALGQEYRAADEEEQQTILNERLPELRANYADKFRELAAAHAGEDVAARALGMVMSIIVDTDERQAVQDELIADYLHSDGLAPSIPLLASDGELLQKLIDESDSRNVRGVALYFQMSAHKGRELNESNEAEVVPLMESIVADYADVELIYPNGISRGTLGEAVDNELFAYQNLRIGLEAPDIEGEDIDGVPFKLSDYRGQVVVIDFWGDW